MKTIIHVNQHKIRAGDEKPLTVKTYKSNTEARRADIIVNGEAVASVAPDHPLSCGARVWIETQHEVAVDAGGGGGTEELTCAA